MEQSINFNALKKILLNGMYMYIPVSRSSTGGITTPASRSSTGGIILKHDQCMDVGVG